MTAPDKKVVLSEEDWRNRLSSDAYAVLRKGGTERAGSSPLNSEKRAGLFLCAACGQPLYDAAAKYESGSGWPSFFMPLSPEAVTEHDDGKLFMRRTEIRCGRCDSHLGHVFPDGPPPTGLRYCMNGTALQFKPSQDISE